MGEVAEMFDVKASLLRHWETQFPVLRPKRNKKGNRLFSPQDVENLKLIYHLVKERGMTLEGAKKALRGQRADKGVSRDAELMERLQRIRALLVEVREVLKAGEGDILPDADIETVAVVPAASAAAGSETVSSGSEPEIAGTTDVADAGTAAASGDVPAETAASVAPPAPRRRKAVVKIVEDAASGAESDGSSDNSAVESSGAESGENPDANSAGEPGKPARRPARKPRRKKEEGENKELFAFYEQSLF